MEEVKVNSLYSKNTMNIKEVTKKEFIDIKRRLETEYLKKVFSIPSTLSSQEYEKTRAEYSNELKAEFFKYCVIPFKINSKKIELIELINALCTDSEVKDSYTLYKGTIYKEYTKDHIIKKINLNILCDKGYECLGYNDVLKLIFDFTDGDICFQIFDTEEDYDLRKYELISNVKNINNRKVAVK